MAQKQKLSKGFPATAAAAPAAASPPIPTQPDLQHDPAMLGLDPALGKMTDHHGGQGTGEQFPKNMARPDGRSRQVVNNVHEQILAEHDGYKEVGR